mmetsp:Transcript_19243/g.52859  ORF Transcript_19243/g.52859 Transcript_19243/m.52859 type:complete len:260 (+) Transcript_19243:183-962(+)
MHNGARIVDRTIALHRKVGNLGPDFLRARPLRLGVHDHVVQEARARRRQTLAERGAAPRRYEHVVLTVVLLDESEAGLLPCHRPGAVGATRKRVVVACPVLKRLQERRGSLQRGLEGCLVALHPLVGVHEPSLALDFDIRCPREASLHVYFHVVLHAGADAGESTTEGHRQHEHVSLAVVLLDESEEALVPRKHASALPGRVSGCSESGLKLRRRGHKVRRLSDEFQDLRQRIVRDAGQRVLRRWLRQGRHRRQRRGHG